MATRQAAGRWAAVLAAAAVLMAVPGCSSGASNFQTTGNLTLDLGDGATMKLVLIPAGKFMMGSPETEKDRGEDEVQHEVTISKPFYMGISPVTVDQFVAFVKDSGYKTDAEKDGWSFVIAIKKGKFKVDTANGCSWRNPSFDQKGDHPVVQVSWSDARAFCDWLSKKSGKTVVLPTESQWEYACRAGTATVFSFGDVDSALGDYAWYVANSGGTMHPVGQKKPNAWATTCTATCCSGAETGTGIILVVR